MEDFKNLAIVEMIHEDGREISIANEIWFADGRLRWPSKNFKGLQQRKFLNLVPASDWLQFSEFNVLQRGLKTIREANERLNFYVMFENTLDKINQDAEKQERRKHPIRYIENHLDYNNVFDELNKCTTSTPNVSSMNEEVESKESALCFLCGIAASIISMCHSCNRKFCIICDKLYHSHPKRISHFRQEMKIPSHVPKGIEVPSQVHESQVQPSTSTKVKNSAGTDDQYLFIPLNRKMVEKSKQRKSKCSTNMSLANKIPLSASIPNGQLDDIDSGELPTLTSDAKQKPSQMIYAAPSKALRCSNLMKNKKDQKEGTSVLYEHNIPQNLDVALKREKELQALSGNSNDIAENKEEKKKAKTVQAMKKDKLVKSVKKSTIRTLSSGSRNIKSTANSGDNKTIKVKKDKLMKTSAKPTTQTTTSGSSDIKPTADSGDNKIAKKIEYFETILICMICGLIGEIRCDQCDSVILCVKCDVSFHNHVLRSGHTRQKLDFPSSVENQLEDEVRPTEKLDIKKPETVTKIMTSAGQKCRRPPPLLLIPKRNALETSSSIGHLDYSLMHHEDSNNGNRSTAEDLDLDSFSKQEKDSAPKCNISTRFSFEGEDCLKLADLEEEMDAPSNEIETSTHEIQESMSNLDAHVLQKEQKQLVKSKCRVRPVQRTAVKVAKGRNAMNKRLLVKMFATVKSIKKDNCQMKGTLTYIKRSQIILRNKLVRSNAEIVALKELLYFQKPKEAITVDRSFVIPKFPIETPAGTQKLEDKCLNKTYCDQLKFTATGTSDVKPSVKRIMDHIFTYKLLMDYSWTGQSELNSGTDEKLKFSTLIGIQSMVTKAATLNLHSTPTVEKDCTAGIKDAVRRASQSFARLSSK